MCMRTRHMNLPAEGRGAHLGGVKRRGVGDEFERSPLLQPPLDLRQGRKYRARLWLQARPAASCQHLQASPRGRWPCAFEAAYAVECGLGAAPTA